MTKLLQTVMVFAVVISVVGGLSLYKVVGQTSVDVAFAQDAPPPDDGGSCCDAPPPDDGGSCCDAPPPDDGGSCCDAPPPDDGGTHDVPPPDDGGGEPPLDDGTCCDAPPPDGGTFEPPPDGSEPPPDGSEPPPDGSQPPPDGGFIEPPPDGSAPPPPDGEFHECADCTFDQPPPDGEFFFAPPPEGSEPTGEFFFEPPTGEFVFEPPPGDFFPDGGEFAPGDFPDGGEFLGPAPDPGFEGTFSFDSRGDFVFDGVPTFDGAPGFEGPGPGGTGFDGGPGDPGYFPDGDFHDFFNPGDFAPDLFVDTFRPDEFKGDFGDFFVGEDFQPGAFDELFDPGAFRPDEFGSFFDPNEFTPGEFGEFAAVGGEFVDFGGHFDQFWGERGEGAQDATAFFDGLAPGEFGFIPPEDLVGELQNMDYQGFQNMEGDFVADLFQNGVGGQEFDLRGDQWAGAFSKFDVEDIHGFDQDFIAGAVQDFAPQDFLGIPDDQAFAMFEATFLGGGPGAPPPGEPFDGEPLPGGTFIGGPAGGPVPPTFFDPGLFEQRLDEFEGQIGGFLGAMGPENFDKIEDGQLVDMFGRIDFSAPDFDPTVIGGEDLGGIFGALEHESLAAMGHDQIFGAIGTMGANDFKGWDPSAAFNVFDTIDFEQAKGMEHMGGLVGAMGPDQYQHIEGGQLVGLFDSFEFGGPGFDLGASGMDRDDIAGMMGAMDFEHMSQLGSEGMAGALQHLDDKAMGAWDGGTAFDVFNTFGFEQALGIDQLEGIVANFDPEQIQQMGDNLGGLLGGLDFQGNGEVLQDFSFDTLGVLSPEEFQALGGEHLANLANTTGGDGLLGLGAGQLFTMVENIDVGAFGEFDPSVVGGMFAGLDHEQIAGIDYDAMDAALEAAGASFLGGLGDFDSISGGETAFDLLAGFSDLEAALEQDGAGVIHDGAFNFFGGDIFGSN